MSNSIQSNGKPFASSSAPHQLLPSWRRYAVAGLSFAASLAVTLLIRAWIGGTEPFYPLFMAGVIAAAWYGGLGPGLLAAALSVVTNAAIAAGGGSHLALPPAAELVRLSAFSLAAVFVSILADARDRALAGIRAHLDKAEKSQRVFDAMMEHIPLGITIADAPDVTVRAVSRFGRELTGRPREEIEGIPVSLHADRWDIYSADGVTPARNEDLPLTRATQKGEVVREEEWVLRRADGARIPILCTAAPIRDADGKITGGVIGWQDMTERKRAEEALRESEQRFRTMADAIPQLAWTARPDGYIHWYNRRWHEYTGMTPEQMEGWGWQSVHDPEVLPKVLEQWRASIATARPFEMVFPLRGADGRFRPFLTRVEPLKDARGRVVQWFGTNTDIEELKGAESAQELLAAIVESSDDAILSKSVDGTVLSWNDGAQRLLGYRAEEIIGKPSAMLLPPERAQEEEENLARLRRGERVERGATVRVARDGRRIDVSVTVSPLKDRDGHVVGASTIIHDITERKRAEEALKAAKLSAEQAKAAAEQASKAKDHFLAVLSHELRTPLAPVVTALSMLQDDPRVDAGIREMLEMVRRNVDLEGRLIDDLLDVARIARGKIELEKKVVPLCEVIRRAVEVCKPDIEARRLHFGVDIGRDAPYLVHADTARLQQVFWNLLKNAIKFTPHGGCVGVRCRLNDHTVIAEINDSGMGIEPAELARIFTAFEQDRSTARPFGGLGLGLAIARAIVEMHGGTIEAHSEGPQRGATFRVRLPVLDASRLATPGREQPAAAVAPSSSTRPLRILLVEDHGDTADMMRLLLTMHGHDVKVAGDVATALEEAGGSAFDLLVSDLGLPDGSGTDLMTELRRRGFKMPGIALSGYGQEQDIRRSREVGFAAHLTKPASADRLAEAIASVTDQT